MSPQDPARPDKSSSVSTLPYSSIQSHFAKLKVVRLCGTMLGVGLHCQKWKLIDQWEPRGNCGISHNTKDRPEDGGFLLGPGFPVCNTEPYLKAQKPSVQQADSRSILLLEL